MIKKRQCEGGLKAGHGYENERVRSRDSDVKNEADSRQNHQRHSLP